MSFTVVSNSSVKQGQRGATLGTATSSFVGVVSIDPVTLNVDQTGKISVKATLATTSVAGYVQPDGTSIALSAGLISIPVSSNGFGVRTVSTLAPVGGNDGDIWYQI